MTMVVATTMATMMVKAMTMMTPMTLIRHVMYGILLLILFQSIV